jgi:DNA mismatch endonuclease, patch repair protein
MARKTPEDRTRMMRAFKARHTEPELAVRRIVHQMGYRFRVCRKDLPGTPDLVFPSRRKVIFVHGCFWHKHGCKLTRVPKLNRKYWIPKFQRNRKRDARNIAALQAEGWRPLIIWECEVRAGQDLSRQLRDFLQ